MNSAPHVSLLSSLYPAMFRVENEQLQANATSFCSYFCVSWFHISHAVSLITWIYSFFVVVLQTDLSF